MQVDRVSECQGGGVTPSPVIEEELVRLGTTDGITVALRIWRNAGCRTRGIVVTIHGMCGHGGYYRYLAEKMTPYGLTIVAPDCRGHGYSEGVRGDLEVGRVLSDLHQVFTYLSSRYPAIPRFLLGESMGGCIAVNFFGDYVSCRNYEIKLNGILLFSPGLGASHMQLENSSIFQSIIFRCLYRFAPSKPIIRMGENGSNRSDPLRIKKVSARYIHELLRCMDRAATERFEDLDIPIIVFHGTDDTIIKLEVVLRFYENLQVNKKELVVVPGGSHCLFNDAVFADYFEVARDFILSHMNL